MGNHSDICTCEEHNPKLLTQAKIRQIDPTRTVSLRNAFVKQMDRRFNELSRIITKAIVDQDCFGFKLIPTTYQMTVPGKQAFAFTTSQQKIQEFMTWLQEQVDKGILTVSEYRQLGQAIQQEWTDLYIEDSYKRGIIRARYEMTKAGWNIPSIEASGGVAMVFANSPFHLDRVGLLYIRAYNDLKGITDAMSSQISRILAQGMADGDGPRLLARKLVATINGDTTGTLGITDTLGRFIPAKRRAEMLARTEIIRSHAEATLQEYRNWGVVGVNVQVEWLSAHDDRVCPVCASMDGKIFTLDEASGLIPAHPNCRCCWLPAGPEHDLPPKIK
jgi:SPP1 gp7 family putative phage head morphogenesis protein